MPPHLFRVLLLERLALPLPVNEARCDGCHEHLDTLGRHLAACWEAGAQVRFNAFLKDTNVHVWVDDERRIDVLAQVCPALAAPNGHRHHTEKVRPTSIVTLVEGSVLLSLSDFLSFSR